MSITISVLVKRILRIKKTDIRRYLFFSLISLGGTRGRPHFSTRHKDGALERDTFQPLNRFLLAVLYDKWSYNSINLL